MPFTPAHAVVALPFVRTPLVPAGIAVGAMSPDVPLFFHVGLEYRVTHDAIAGPLVGIPLALLLLLVWRLLLRPAVPQLTPRWFAQRWPREWSSPADGWWSLWGGRAAPAPQRWAAAALLGVSLLLGIATHILWDSFTHSGRWGSEVLPALRGSFLGEEWTQWLQHASSAIGLAIIGIWGWVWLRRRDPQAVTRVVPIWFTVAVWAAMPVILAVTTTAALLAGYREVDATAVRAGTTAGAAILLLLAIAAAVILVRMPRHARDSGSFGVPGADT